MCAENDRGKAGDGNEEFPTYERARSGGTAIPYVRAARTVAPGSNRRRAPFSRLYVFRSLALCTVWMVWLDVRAHAGEELPEVRVSGTRIVDDVPVDEAEVPASVTVIRVADYKDEVKTVEDLLADQAGVEVKRYGGLGSFSTVSIRGSSSSQVLVFLDGVLLNRSIGGGVDLSTIPLSNVDFIEVYRGVTPARFGASGMAGVINIRTKRAGPESSSFIKSLYGSFGTYGGSVFHSERRENFDFLFSSDYLSSEGDYKFLDDNATQFNAEDDRIRRRVNNWFRQSSTELKFGVDLDSGWRLDFSDGFFKKEQGIPGRSNNQSTEATFTTTRNLATLRLFGTGLFCENDSLTWQLSHTYTIEKFFDPLSQVGLGQQDTRNVTEQYASNLNWRVPLGKYQDIGITYEPRFEEYRPHDSFLSKDAQPVGSSRWSHSLSIEDVISLINGRLTAIPTLRWDLYSTEQDRGSSDEQEERYLNKQLGLKYDLTSWLALKANASQSVRVPSFYELFGDRGITVGNADLLPERSRNFDVGFRLNPRCQGVLDDLSFEVTAFRHKVDDLILFVYDARGIGRAENFSRTVTKGVEVSNSFTLLKHLRITQNMTWQDPRNLSDVEAYENKLLPNRSQSEYSGKVELFDSKRKLYFEITRTGTYFRDMANLVQAPSQTIANLGVSFKYGAFTVGFEVKNIADRRVEDIAGYPQPGRSFFVTLQAEF